MEEQNSEMHTGQFESLLSREEAFDAINRKAREEGINGSYKVFYNGQIVAGPSDLPETVNMELVRVSAMFDNA